MVAGDSRWAAREEDLEDLDPVKARDLIVRCFFESQRETFAEVKQRIGTPADDETVRRTVVAAVRISMTDAGGDFDHPTVETLGGAVQALAGRAASWGTPHEIISYHKGQIERILGALRSM
jgi:hypothetical protein